MVPDKPEEWPRAFARHLDAGDLESVMELYEPGTRFVAPSGETLVGRDQIRGPVTRLIQAQTHLQERVVRATVVDGIALTSAPACGPAAGAAACSCARG